MSDAFAIVYDTMMLTSCLDAGIHPFRVVADSVERDLAKLPPPEARKLKRKFRKLWRRARRKEIALRGTGRELDKFMRDIGNSGEKPGRRELWHRKMAVKQAIMARHLPALQALHAKVCVDVF